VSAASDRSNDARFATAREPSVSDGLDVEIRNRVAYLTLDRPQHRNALSIALTRTLIDRLIDLDENDDVWAISITGAGEAAFCAGTDLKELDERAKLGQGPPIPMRGPHRNLFEVVIELGKPTLAVLNGAAMGAGCELALACDMRIGAEHARLALPEAKRGMGANFGSVVLPRLLPRAIAFQMLYTGEPMTAADALTWGLLNDVVPAADLRRRGEELIRAIVANAPLTLQRYKQMVTKSWGTPLHSALRLNVGPNVYLTRDREEGVRAFVEKRVPRWEAR
jgi:enoyl-CoA hydratase